jgi:hypothetical protein
LAAATSSSFTISAGPAARIAWSSTSSTHCDQSGTSWALAYTACGGSGTTFKSKLTLTDQYGNPVTNTGTTAIPVTVTKSGGSFTGSASVTIAIGASQSNSGGDSAGTGEITFVSDSGQWGSDALTATPTGYLPATASFTK